MLTVLNGQYRNRQSEQSIEQSDYGQDNFFKASEEEKADQEQHSELSYLPVGVHRLRGF